GASGSQLGKKDSIADTARVLAGMFDGIEYRGFGQERAEELAAYSSVPVWNGLTNEWHPTQFLADMLTIREYGPKPFNATSLAYLGDGRYNMGNSLMIGCAMLGLDFRCVGPRELWTSDEVYEIASEIATRTGAEISREEDVAKGVKHCDFIYTDVWLSMGESEEAWEERIRMLLPYRVTNRVMRLTGNPGARFLHCLPSFHNRDTTIGESIYQKFGLDCMEVDDEVFESDRNLAFAEAANRMHTIKAVMVATLAGDLLPPAY
ncbi:MAG: ornithine carbamoyltransferase subunit F, partial [Desulfovibrio sp.]|nr:ornithine carbamoyltransferase subunit F [Desulfovibrio sp.]